MKPVSQFKVMGTSYPVPGIPCQSRGQDGMELPMSAYGDADARMVATSDARFDLVSGLACSTRSSSLPRKIAGKGNLWRWSLLTSGRRSARRRRWRPATKGRSGPGCRAAEP